MIKLDKTWNCDHYFQRRAKVGIVVINYSDNESAVMTRKQIILIAILALGLGVGGFFIGRHSVESKIKETSSKIEIQYLPGKDVHDTIPVPVPVKVYVDTGSIKYIPKEILVNNSVDSTQLLKDYKLTRVYSNKLFENDSLGKLIVNSEVRYNRLQNLSYNFTPRTRIERITEIHTIESKRVEPYLGIGLMTNNLVLGQGGVFLKNNIGLGGLYQYDTSKKQSSFGLNILIKF